MGVGFSGYGDYLEVLMNQCGGLTKDFLWLPHRNFEGNWVWGSCFKYRYLDIKYGDRLLTRWVSKEDAFGKVLAGELTFS